MIGERLKELREDGGYTQHQLSSMINITRQSLSQYETNVYEPPLELLVRIADLFNVSIDYLCCRTKDKDNPNIKKKG